MAQLAIPSAPRRVRLTQVPGALRGVATVAALAGAATLLAWALAFGASGWLSKERAFLERAVPVRGTVVSVALPPVDERDHRQASLQVLYQVDGAERSASGVELSALAAEGLGRGAAVDLLVDPARPDHPREAGEARSRAPLLWLANLLLGVGVLATLALIARELRKAWRRQLAPLRTGAIVWLTPAAPLPDAPPRGEVSFAASYYRDDVRHEVTARADGGAWIRQNEKVLAALVPGEPTWVRVIDERLARRLGWYR
jgi:hypothetical protein